MLYFYFFFFNDRATTEIYTLSLHDALPISEGIVAPRDLGLKCFVGVRVQAGHATIAGLKLRQELGKLAVAGRTTHQANPRRALENLLAFLLRHTAQHTDHLASIRPSLELAQARKYLLRRFFTDATSVIEYQRGGLGRIHLAVAAA